MNKKDRKAISSLKNHKSKINDSITEMWAVEALEYVSKYFPKESQFEYAIRNITIDRNTTDKFKKSSCEQIFDSMISYIEAEGIFDQPRKNILSDLNPEFLYLILTALLGLGFFFGQLWEKYDQKSSMQEKTTSPLNNKNIQLPMLDTQINTIDSAKFLNNKSTRDEE